MESLAAVAKQMDECSVDRDLRMLAGPGEEGPQQPCWLVVGSGPSATTMMELARKHPYVQSITANAGIDLLPDPDYYLIYETEAAKLFADYVPFLRHKHGTSLVATKGMGKKKSLRSNLARLDPEYVIEVAITKSHGGVHYHRGRYTAGSFTGSIMVQFALEHGARTVMIVGMEGYKGGKHDTFDGRSGNALHAQMTKTIYGPMMQLMVNAWPEVEFVFFGKPNYAIAGDNVIVIDEEKFDVHATGSELLHGPPEVPDVLGGAGPELRQDEPAPTDPAPSGSPELGSELRPEGEVPPRPDEVAAGTPVVG
jgi:hypothetical protein